MNTMTLLTLFVSLSASASDGAVSISDRAAELRRTQPEVAAEIDSLQPIRNRAGGYFFPGDRLTESDAQALLLDRLIHGDDESDVRTAVAYALVEPLPWSVIRHQSAPVRVALLEAHKKSADPAALLSAVADEAPEVVSEAVRLLGYTDRTSSKRVRESLERSLVHDSGEIRRLAARSIGWRGDVESFEKVQPLLTDPRPGVREAAVRALGRLDKSRAAGLEALQVLASDNHPGTKRAVRSVMTP